MNILMTFFFFLNRHLEGSMSNKYLTVFFFNKIKILTFTLFVLIIILENCFLIFLLGKSGLVFS